MTNEPFRKKLAKGAKKAWQYFKPSPEEEVSQEPLLEQDKLLSKKQEAQEDELMARFPPHGHAVRQPGGKSRRKSIWRKR